MKVDVVTVDQVKIKPWRWHSNWIDVAVINYGSRPFLIQMRVSRTNAKSFRAVSMTGTFYRQATADAIGDLVQMTRKEGK